MSGSSNLSNLASLVQTFITGSGNKNTTQTNSGGTSTGSTVSSGGTSTGTTATSSTAAPEAIAALQSILTSAQANGTDTSKLTDLVNNLFTQAGQNFLPTVGAASASGLYNSSTLGLLSDQSKGNAINQAATAVLNYQTQQQQIASNAATSLAAATKGTTQQSSQTTPQTTQQQTQTTPQTTQTQVASTAAVIPSSITSLLGAGLGAYTLYKNSNNILGALGMGSKGGTTAATEAAIGQSDPAGVATDINWDAMSGAPVSASDQFSSIYDVSPDAGLTNLSGSAGVVSGGGIDWSQQAVADFGNPASLPANTAVDATGNIVGAGGDQASAFLNASSDAASSSSFVADAASAVGDAASTVADTVSSAASDVGGFFGDVGTSVGDAVGSAASDVGDFVSSIFDWF